MRAGPGRRLTSVLTTIALILVSAVAGVVATPAPPAEAQSVPTIVAIRAAHHPGYDRIVFEFDREKAPRATVSYVSKLIGDFSGEVVPVPGRAVIRVILRDAQAHTDFGDPTVDTNQAFALPNIMALRNAGDFEAVVTLGIGVAMKRSFHVHRLTKPGRIAIDVRTNFSRTTRKVYFQDLANFQVGKEPYVRAVLRPVPDAYPAKGLLDRIFAGPTNKEWSQGLRLVTSQATGHKKVSVRSKVARLSLAGGCDSGGSTFTIANEIMPTLRRLKNVSWVKIYDTKGRTETPRGRSDSIPECLEP
ncbi:MAG: hypothetical protein WCF04_05355 [Candidatus Nanopelagicales bacterium]